MHMIILKREDSHVLNVSDIEKKKHVKYNSAAFNCNG